MISDHNTKYMEFRQLELKASMDGVIFNTVYSIPDNSLSDPVLAF